MARTGGIAQPRTPPTNRGFRLAGANGGANASVCTLPAARGRHSIPPLSGHWTELMKILSRVATSEDYAFLRNLNRLAYEDLVKRQFGIWDDNLQKERFDSKLQCATFRIVELAGRPIAAVWSSEHADHVYLHELLVLPEFQNQGIGSQILRCELDRAESVKKPIRVHALLLNRALGFYKRHGFIETGRSDLYVDMEKKG